MLVFGVQEEGVIYTDRFCVYGVVRNDLGQIGLVTAMGKFSLPGGGIELFEDYNTALQREFLEETGYTVQVQESIGQAIQYIRTLRDNKAVRKLSDYYHVDLLEYSKKPTEQDFSFVWYSREEAISKLHSTLQGAHAWAITQAETLS